MTGAILLAGGKSRRMGENKAFLEFDGKSFINIQLEKLCSMEEIGEIIISGDCDVLIPALKTGATGKRIRIIPDIIKDKGPLGGLYSCLKESACDTLLVIGVDTPLIKTTTLEMILSHHLNNKEDATVLSVASHIEPLIAAYSADIYPLIKNLIDNDSLSLMSLLSGINTYYLEFTGDPSEILNCNTRDDYQNLHLRP